MTVQSSNQNGGIWVWVPRPDGAAPEPIPPTANTEPAPTAPPVAPIQPETAPAPVPTPIDGGGADAAPPPAPPPSAIGTPPVSPTLLTEDMIANMTVAQVNANWDAISKLVGWET